MEGWPIGLPGYASGQQCGSIAMKLNRLDACKDGKVVRWYRTQASSHNPQAVVDNGVNEAGASTAAPDRNAVAYSVVECTRAKVAVRNIAAPAPNRSQQAASKAQHVMTAFCEVTQGVGDT